MERLSPTEYRRNKASQHEDVAAAAREISDELGRIVQSKGWRYAKSVSYSEIVKPFECEPPRKGEDATQWQTYNTIRWAFERFFAQMEILAGVKPQTPKGQ